MNDTRPIMSDAEFDQAANYVDEGWWMTGESLIHVKSVMDVFGWDRYGHPGNLSLTPAQRVLMMWSDIVGQVANGGFEQYCDNYAKDLALGLAAVRALKWPDLQARFERAMIEQAGSLADPVLKQPVALTDEPEKWQASRKRLIRHLAGLRKPWWKPITRANLAFVEEHYGEVRLQLAYQQLVLSGE